MKPLNVVVVGTGMYVCGRGTEGYGTVIPALCEWKRAGRPGEVIVAGHTAGGVREAEKKIRSLGKRMGVDTAFRYVSGEGAAGRQGYREAFRVIPKPAACIIALPDHMHADAAARAIRSGMHTLVVKPLTPTCRETRALIALQKERGVYCAVEFHKRFDLANLKLRDVVRSGMIGDPLYFLVEYSQRKSVPAKHFRKWVGRTDIFQYLGVHYVDVIYFVTGARPVRAMALAQKGWLSGRGIDAYDAIEALIEWRMPSGKRFTSSIITNWVDPESTSAMSDQKIKVVGTKGRFESDQKRRGIQIVTDTGGIEEPNPYFSSPYGAAGSVTYQGYGIDSIRRFLEDVADIEAGRTTVRALEGARPTFAQSLVPAAVLDTVRASIARGGAWVTVERV